MNKELIRKVAVFDFDGTLINTMEPIEGRKIWKEKTKTEFPHKGWWSKPETLDINVFENRPFDDIASKYSEESENKRTFVTLCTGRLIRLENEVKAILDKYDFQFDDIILNGDRRFVHKGGNNDTLAFKIRYLGSLIKQFPNLEEIEMWDDRTEHIPTFIQWGKLQKIPVKINHVKH